MTDAPYRILPDDPALRRLGLIVLQVDETVEADLHRLIPASAARLHVTRIASGAELTPDTIAGMEADLTRAAALLPDARFDAIGYACTSATAQLGADRVAALIRAGRVARQVTDPLGAVIAALRQLGARSVALVSPYIPAVAAPIRDALQAAGVAVPHAVTFGEKVEARVARIDPDSIRDAAIAAQRACRADCTFISCTNLRCLDILDAVEAETGAPALSSNQVLAWHMARSAGVAPAPGAPGRLFRR
ncbi:MAG: maleate isomerase NicE [Rhodobacteraceae bacterium HLUCCA08]|nr:MAG: maleate isomerase NicE [Rhodobacteraceae bacterium HLUCCA08]